MEFPRDTMEELLLRLPLKAVTRFKCVSKYWNNLISTDEFHKWYQTRRHNVSPNGFAYQVCDQRRIITKFVCTSNINKKEYCLSKDLRELGQVVGSSKGLLLLITNKWKYFVYDLLTRNYVLLPKTLTRYNRYKHHIINGFICREHEKSVSKTIIGSSSFLIYKVLVIGCGYYVENKSMYKVETYSSETGKWTISVMTTALGFVMDFTVMATTIGDLLYWKSHCSKYVLAYDPENPTGRAKVIEFPILEHYGEVTISGSQDGCHLFMIEKAWEADADIKVWSLAKEKYFDEDIVTYAQWKLLHKISSVDLERHGLDFGPVRPVFVKCAGIRPQDSTVIILRVKNEFILYNVNDKRVRTIMLKGDEAKCVNEYFRFHERPTWPCIY